MPSSTRPTRRCAAAAGWTADTPLPDDWFTLRKLLTDTVEQIVGVPLTSRDASVYLPEFDPGHGMSAGAVHLPWWAHTGVPILLDRYAALRQDG